MDLIIPAAWAQAGEAARPGGGGLQFIFLLVMFGLLYFALLRPQMKRAKEHRAMVERLGVGDEVVTSGGLLGKIVAVDDNFLKIEVAKGVVLNLQRHHAAQDVPKGTYKSE